MTELALEGVRVADFSWVFAGPLCTRYLASMGAEVIKIESRRRPDGYRVGPARDESGAPLLNRAANFNLLAYSKKSLSLDLSKPEAIALAKRLIAISDLVVENFGAGFMERMGLAYEDLKQMKPEIIMASSSGLGRTGPESHFVAYGQTLHAYSGLTSLTGYVGGPPRGLSGAFSDPLTGTVEVLGVLAALYHRRMTGEGQYLDLSMAEATVSHLPEATLDYLVNERTGGCLGNEDAVMAPHGVYRCKGEDAWVAIAVGTEAEWQGLCRALEHPAWIRDPKFSEATLRWQHRDELDQHLESWTRARDRFQAMHVLQREGVPAGPVFDARDAVEDPQLRARGFYVELDHPEVGRKLYVGLPWKLSPDHDVRYEPPPLLGEHSAYVCKELLGLSDAEFSYLVEAEVIY